MSDSSMLSDWLPTKRAQKIALATLPIATGGAALVHFLRPLMPVLTEAEITLLQISVALLLVLLCALAALRSIVTHVQTLEKKHAAEIASIRKEHDKGLNAEKRSEDFMTQQINYPPNGIV